MGSTRNIGLGVGVTALLGVIGCQGPEAFYRDGGDFGSVGAAGTVAPTGVAGTTGAGGVTGAGGMVTGTGGSVAGTGGPTAGTGGGVTGAAGTNGRGGTTGTGGGAAGTNGRGGATGIAGTNGRGGAAGTSAGRGGTTGAGGTAAAGTNGRGGNAGTSAGRGGTTGAAAGTSGGGTPTVLFSDDFESYPAGTAMPATWTRSGGSMGDWTFAPDGTQVLEQNANLSSTPRTEFANATSWSGALSVAARVKILATGSSNQSAQVCLRYMSSSNYYCAALVPTGVQILTAVGGAAGQSGVFASTVATMTWYDLKISVDAGGLLSASLGGSVVGTYMPAALASGYAAVGTASMRAAFDDVVVTRP